MVCLLIFYQYDIVSKGLSMANNTAQDMMLLIIAPVTALYILAFIGKKLEGTIVGKIVAYVGEQSFWVMGLHYIGFHFATTLLRWIGVKGLEGSYQFTPTLSGNVTLLIAYLVIAIAFSLGLIYICRKIIYCIKSVSKLIC